MSHEWFLNPPAILPPLDTDFKPAVLCNRTFQVAVKDAGAGMPLVLGLERSDGTRSRFETRVFSDDHELASANLMYIERILKFLLWQRGGYKVYVGGSTLIADYLHEQYKLPPGKRQFDAGFMGESVYENDFEVLQCSVGEVPAAHEISQPLGRHLEGCRIGFDLGASDRKVTAVIDGKCVYSEEVVWEPRKHNDPAYHYSEIKKALETAASKLPRVDAIGGSSAGVYVNNRAMVASLFRGVPKEQFGVIREMFLRIGEEMGVPIVVVNDGEVTALAGSMSLEANGVLGIALGSSEAGGYVNQQGNITTCLNELAFAPVDYNPNAPCDEWSGDYGVGALYFSQQCVFRLAPKAGISLPEGEGVTDAERLQAVQKLLESDHEGAVNIWKSIGVYMGYTLAHYADFYDMDHVLILGRCTSGSGGDIILDGARQVLQSEFPDLAVRLTLHLPDEKNRRVGQAIAAASLPRIK